jgi:peroxin-3
LNIKDCHFVVESLLPSLKDNIFQELNVEFLTSQLKQKQVDSNTLLEESKKQKREMWNELKIQAICRTIAAIYLLNLLTLFTTVQLSLLGRILYLDSVRALASSAQTSDLDPKQGTNTFRSISEEIERQYLTLSWYILNIGWKQCVERIRKSVLKHTMMVPLTMAFTHDSLMELIYNIRQDVDHENGQLFRFDTFLLPVEGSEGFVFSQGGVSKTDTLDPSLQLLLDETRDFLER